MKIEHFKIKNSLWIERQEDRDGNVSFIAWKPHQSRVFFDKKTLLKFCKWPIKTPTGDSLREWLNEVEKVKPSEPQENTKMII